MVSFDGFAARLPASQIQLAALCLLEYIGLFFNLCLHFILFSNILVDIFIFSNLI